MIILKNAKTAKIFMIVSMIIFGSIALFVRKINLSSGEIALYRALLAVSIIGAFLLFKKKEKINISKKDLILLFASGMFMGLNWIFLFEAYKYTTVSIATLSYYFAPIIVTLICPIILKEKMKFKNWICFAMSTVGIVLITGLGESNHNNHIIGILFGLTAAILYASVILINKCIKTVDGIYRTFLQFIAAIIVLLPYVLVTSGININSLNSTGWINLIIVGVVHTGITYCLYFISLKDLKGQTVAILSYIDPLVAIFLSIVILKEPMNFLQIVGGILILVFTLINEISLKKIFKERNKDEKK